jgi:nicotinic acid phosphoribosyltransferase
MVLLLFFFFFFSFLRRLSFRFLNYAWTEADVAIADQFYATHNVGGAFPFPKELFLKFIKENKGYFPIKVEALEEGTVANAHTPVYQITAEAEYAHLITFFETILTHVWYPTCVATLSRRAKEIIQVGFDKSVDPDSMGLIDSKLHDFGFRGCTSVEQAIIGGLAHLLNFVGSDTMPAAFYGQFKLNNGKPIAVVRVWLLF